MDDYAIINTEEKTEYIGTNGLSACVGVVASKPETNIGAVSHSIPISENIVKPGGRLVEEMLVELKKDYNIDSIKATIITGADPQTRKLKQTYYTLEKSDIIGENIEWRKMGDKNSPSTSGSAVLEIPEGEIEPLSWLN